MRYAVALRSPTDFPARFVMLRRCVREITFSLRSSISVSESHPDALCKISVTFLATVFEGSTAMLFSGTIDVDLADFLKREQKQLRCRQVKAAADFGPALGRAVFESLKLFGS
jgi:hypothetical protein